jgi:GNAT superfamily N-acetyltransferase
VSGAPVVRSTGDPALALRTAWDFLAARPVENNLVLSLLRARVDRPQAGRYWWAVDGGDVVGFTFLSPPEFRAVVGRAEPAVVDVLVEAVAEEAPDLAGVMADAATAAAFAGRWAERRRVPVSPIEGQRIYRLGRLRHPQGTPGRLRQADPADRDLLVGWAAGFLEETGVGPLGPGDVIDGHLRAGRLWVWEDGEPVSVAGASPVVAGVSRIALVYTPPERRRRGYAAACVAALSERVLAPGPGRASTCILYTQLQNPTSNAVYRGIGFEPVVELVIYRFG